jgi:hypothetical protein
VLVLALALALRPVSIEGTAHCPSPAALARALADMLPEARIADGDGALVVRIDDLGARFRLRVGADTRELADGGRRCEERARQAAVVVALALAPPSVEEPPTPMLAPPTAEAAAPPPTEAEVRAPIEERPAPRAIAPRALVAFELGAGLHMAPSADGGTLAEGALALRLAAGRPRFQILLGVAATSPSTMKLAPAPVSMTRFPIDLSARYVARAGKERETAFDVGAVGDVLLLEAASGAGGNRLSLGVRAAASERFWLTDDAAIFASIETAFLPNTYALVIDDGMASRPEGHTPDFWLGLSLGCVVRVR